MDAMALVTLVEEAGLRPVEGDMQPFSLRHDRNGQRVVFNLGNEAGDCPYRCTFCSVGRSPVVTATENLEAFIEQKARLEPDLEDRYHALIYNQGNVTSPHEFSPWVLERILRELAQDERVTFVSLNSREHWADERLFEALSAMALPFPIHFIFGVESFSPRAAEILGKYSEGEFERFVTKLKNWNQLLARGDSGRDYAFGMDANLVLLPELYLPEGESRPGNEEEILEGIREEMRELLARMNPAVPVEINLHPYHRVSRLPYEDLDLDLVMAALPDLQAMVESFNSSTSGRETHLFVGVEGEGFDSDFQQDQVARWGSRIERFNANGRFDPN